MLDKEEQERFGKRIRTYLEKLNMSQAELANKLGVSAQAVTSWCKGDKTPRMDKFDKMCAIFGCTRAELISEENAEITAERNKAIELYEKYKNLTPEKKAEFDHFLEFLQSKP